MSRSKPGVDWYEIKRRYELGETAYSISKDPRINVSKQAIQYRANDNGWTRPGKHERQAEAMGLADSASMKALDNPQTRSEKFIAAYGKRTPENLTRILSDIESGLSQRMACNAVGIDPETLRKWGKADPQVSVSLRAALTNQARRRVQKIEDAGDWKAAQTLLASNPFTSEEFAQGAGAAGGTTINVTLNIPRADNDIVTIEHEKAIEHGPE